MYEIILIERQGQPGDTLLQNLRVRITVTRWQKVNKTLVPPQYRVTENGLVQAYWEFETEAEAVMFKLMWNTYVN